MLKGCETQLVRATSPYSRRGAGLFYVQYAFPIRYCWLGVATRAPTEAASVGSCYPGGGATEGDPRLPLAGTVGPICAHLYHASRPGMPPAPTD